MSKSRHMSERQDKTPEQISDEDYKVAPTKIAEKRAGNGRKLLPYTIKLSVVA